MQTIAEELQAFLAEAPEIKPEAQYWFVRTQGGTLFQAFLASSSIAINYSKIPLAEVPASDDPEKETKMRALISKHYPAIKQPGFVANQILTFCYGMKKGDFVICPSYGTHSLALGTIGDSKAFEEELVVGDREYSDFRLRRSVHWAKKVERSEVNPKLLAILLTHQTIVSANSFAAIIDPMFYDFFRKGNEVHYVMDVEQTGQINAHTLFGACSELLSKVDDIAEKEDLPQDSSALSTRINLNSPGAIEFAAANPALCVAVLAILVVALNGGGLKLKIKDTVNLDLGGDGLLKRISDFLDAKSERRLTESMKSKLEKLAIKDSRVILDLLEKRRGKNKE